MTEEAILVMEMGDIYILTIEISVEPLTGLISGTANDITCY